ncbi:MAG: hypothetical protein AABY53_08500 [Bdellovibrionota bacterium]
MKYKLYSYFNDKIKRIAEQSQALTQFELQEPNEDSITDLLKRKYNVIEFDGARYKDFMPFVKAVDWKTNSIGTADCILLTDNAYKPYNILAESIASILKKNVARVNSQLPVIIIGDVHFVMSVASKLALSGFIKIVVSLVVSASDSEESILREFERKIRSFVFNLDLKIIPISELTSADQAGFLLISNFKREQNKDAYDLLVYFNFLSEGASFFDCNSIEDSYLVDDARKADIFVIDEVEILENKYNNLLELLKNHSLV